MSVPQAVMDEIRREIGKIGDDYKTLRSSLMTDLAAVRGIAEEAKASASNDNLDAVLKPQIDALATSVTEKQAILEKGLTGRIDQLQATLQRLPLGGGGEEDGKLEERARRYSFTSLARRGAIKDESDITPDMVDIDGYKLWEDNFRRYLRLDDRAVEHRAMTVGSDPEGGYRVPTAVSERIVMKVFETSPIRALATVETIGTDALELHNDLNEFDFGWVGETQARPNTATGDVGMLRIPVHEQYAKPKVSQKLIEDAGFDVEGWAIGKISDRFARAEATGFVSGDGIEKPRGLLTYAAGTNIALKQVEQINSGAAATVTGDGLINLVYALKEFYTANASWLMKRATVANVLLLKDNDGQYLWRPGLQAGTPSSLLGYAVREANDFPVVGGGSLAIAFGDFRAAYTIVDRLGITVLRDPYSAKPMVELYARRRVGGAVVNFEAFKILVIAA